MIKYLICLIILLSGCTNPVTYGPELTETAEVVDTCYVPAGHGSDVNVGFTTNGDLAITPVNINIPARYAVVFKCKHGKFIIDNENYDRDRAKKLYHKLCRGNKVLVKYCEKRQIIKQEECVIGLHFIDANIIGSEQDSK